MKTICTNKEIGKLIHAYEISAISDELNTEFETHIIKCEACFEELQKFENESEILKSTDLLSKIDKDRLQIEKKPIWNSFNATSAILAALVVLMVYPTFLGFKSKSYSSVRAVESIALVPIRSSDNGFLVSQKNDIVISFVYSESEIQKTYNLEIFSEEKLIYSDDSFQNFDSYHTGRILIPKEYLVSGDYKCILKDNENNNGKVLQQYYFHII